MSNHLCQIKKKNYLCTIQTTQPQSLFLFELMRSIKHACEFVWCMQNTFPNYFPLHLFFFYVYCSGEFS